MCLIGDIDQSGVRELNCKFGLRDVSFSVVGRRVDIAILRKIITEGASVCGSNLYQPCPTALSTAAPCLISALAASTCLL